MDRHSSPFDKPSRIVEEATDTTPAHGIVFETEEEAALWDAALSYRRVLESAPTLDVCFCLWTELKGKKVLGNTHPLCPVHSREGVLVGFIECLKTLPQWTVVFKPSEPDPNGVTLEVQSTAQGSTTCIPESDIPLVRNHTANMWLLYDYTIARLADADGFSDIDMSQTLISKAEYRSRLAACTVEYWPNVERTESERGLYGDGPSI